MDQSPLPARQNDIDAFLGVRPPSRFGAVLKWGAIALGALLLILLAARLLSSDGEPVHYATDTVARGDFTVSVSATGNLQPTNQVDVGSELSGLVTRVTVDNNDRVRQGQVLATIDTARLQDAINQSQAARDAALAQVTTAEATARQNRSNLRRLQEVYRLSGGKVPSATELDTGRADAARADAAVLSAQATVAQTQAQLSSDRTQFQRASILSPVNGVVLSRQIAPGQTVAASLNAPVLFVIAEDLSRMRLEVKVDEADVGQVAAGQRATFAVDAFPGRTFPARIERVDVGANTGTAGSSSSTTSASSSTASSTGTVVAYTARLTVENPDLLLRPGMTATADIITSEKRGVLLVPNAALRFTPAQGKATGTGGILAPRGPPRGDQPARSATIGRGSRQTLYVLDDDNHPQAIAVVIGDTNGSQTEISGGALRPGMRVITGTMSASASAPAGGGRPSGGR